MGLLLLVVQEVVDLEEVNVEFIFCEALPTAAEVDLGLCADVDVDVDVAFWRPECC